MIIFIQIVAFLSGLLGIIGSVAPILPGPLLSLLGIFLLQRFTPQDRSTNFLLIMSGLTIITMVSDYFLPILGTKKRGGSKAGVRGSTIGLIVGLFVIPPFGLLLGPLVGAFIGEWRQKRDKQQARRAARGSFIGGAASTVVKLIVSSIHMRYIIQAIW